MYIYIYVDIFIYIYIYIFARTRLHNIFYDVPTGSHILLYSAIFDMIIYLPVETQKTHMLRTHGSRRAVALDASFAEPLGTLNRKRFTRRLEEKNNSCL